ncbi:hypothetical protein [Dactylococcopsis salina]|uniref:hypothetical protein n=1 Tax=Dactylococcopsis salina TaxID=292566 RepID=UPI0012EA0392|nr:hypothetical protein [Dactylococcopsis salina]
MFILPILLLARKPVYPTSNRYFWGVHSTGFITYYQRRHSPNGESFPRRTGVEIPVV